MWLQYQAMASCYVYRIASTLIKQKFLPEGFFKQLSPEPLKDQLVRSEKMHLPKETGNKCKKILWNAAC